MTIAYSASIGRSGVRRYNGEDFNDNRKGSIGVESDRSRVFVTGYRTRHGGGHGTIAYDASTGTRSWLRELNGTADSDDQAPRSE